MCSVKIVIYHKNVQNNSNYNYTNSLVVGPKYDPIMYVERQYRSKVIIGPAKGTSATRISQIQKCFTLSISQKARTICQEQA